MYHLRDCPQPTVANTDRNPEDGFDEDMDYILASRKNAEKLSDWQALYARLFQVGVGEHIPTSGTYHMRYMLVDPLVTSG